MRIKNLLQGMMDSFDKSAAGGLEAIIQFNFIDHPEEKYFLEIKDNDCRLIEGNSKDKDVIIHTPFIVWRDICIGKLEGQQALMESKYWIEGDFSLMIKFDKLFTINSDKSAENRNESDPLPIKGMPWLFVDWIPWMIFYIMGAKNPFFATSAATLLAFIIIFYRWKFIEISPFDIGSAIVFPIMNVIAICYPIFLNTYSSIVGSLSLALIWISSLISAIPLTAYYSKWDYPQGYEKAPLFLKTNKIITLVWGSIFILTAIADILKHFNPANSLLWSFLGKLLFIFGGLFTAKFPSWYPAYVASNPKKESLANLQSICLC